MTHVMDSAYTTCTMCMGLSKAFFTSVIVGLYTLSLCSCTLSRRREVYSLKLLVVDSCLSQARETYTRSVTTVVSGLELGDFVAAIPASSSAS